MQGQKILNNVYHFKEEEIKDFIKLFNYLKKTLMDIKIVIRRILRNYSQDLRKN